MAEEEITEGTIWVLAHWLLPAKATKEDAFELIATAEREYKTGLELRGKDW